jgi:5-(carboxyamino)imidazole ribonucleotide mutase
MQKTKDYKASLASSVEERDARLQQKIAEMN